MAGPEVTDIKIRDIRFLGTDNLIMFQKFNNFVDSSCLFIVVVARLLSFCVVGSLDLTW